MARTPSAPPTPAPMQQPVAPPPQIMQQQRKVSLLEAIAAATNSFGELVKDTKNEFTKSPYQKLPALLQAIKPALLDQGIVIYTQVLAVSSAWVVRTTLALVDGSEELSSDFPITDASSMQKIGAAMTFGTRYNLYALLAVCPVEDDDGNSGSYNAPVGATVLPGLPGGAPAQPQPGQHVQAPTAMYQQAAPMPPAMANPVQPLSVLPPY